MNSLNIFAIMSKVMRRQFDNVVKSMRRVTKFLSKPYQIINKFIRGMIKTIFLPPQEKSDYFPIGQRFVAKKVIFLTLALVAVGAFLLGNYVIPAMEGVYWAPTITLNSGKFHTFSGKAKVVTENRQLIYEGTLQDGRFTGRGAQYDLDGKLIYNGDLLNEEYNGQGELFDGGVLLYRGTFKRSKFEGPGTLFAANGVAIYEGDFLSGQPSGEGMAFDSITGKRSYQGQFLRGHFEGQGQQFASDGTTLIYEGAFLSGQRSGQGREYDGETLVYEGAFLADKRSGQGREYDIATGRMVYEGTYVEGQRQGFGLLYDVGRGNCVFEGQFYMGEIDYAGYLGASLEELRRAFKNETFLDYLDEGFVVYYKPLSVALICEYADLSREKPTLRRIMAAGNRTVSGMQEGDGQDAVLMRFGDSFTQVGLVLDTPQRQAFARMNKAVGDAVYSDKYILDNFYYRYYYDHTGQVSCMEIGAV